MQTGEALTPNFELGYQQFGKIWTKLFQLKFNCGYNR